MGYPFEDLDDAQFERLVVQMARKLFGFGVQGFATGPDGGRDARFHGAAERFPSTAAPWTGATVFQAKHTNATNTHFSDAAFSGPAASSVLTKEIPRIKTLAGKSELHNYVLMANRRLGAVADEDIANRIASETGVPRERIFLAGVEYLEEMLHHFPDILGLARINPLEGPLLVSSWELAEVILGLAKELDAPLPTIAATDIERTSYAEKNRLNGMSEDFAKELQERYLSITRQIDEFLADPANAEITKNYAGAVEELQLQLIAKRGDFVTFDVVFNHLASTLIARDGVLSRDRRLTRAVLFYMYWHCDIGKTADANAE